MEDREAYTRIARDLGIVNDTLSPAEFLWAKVVSLKRVCYSHVTVISVFKSDTVI
jgi:hypothetical protein